MRYLIGFIAFLLIGIILSYAYPYNMINPGVLQSGHASLKSDCMACHTVLKNTPDDKCRGCHSLPSIGLKNVAGQSLSKPSQRNNLIHNSLATECASCHTEHAGSIGIRNTQNFSHKYFTEKVKQTCEPCHSHQRPADLVHATFNGDCKQCHTDSDWKYARFDHSVKGASLVTCLDCHKKDIPADELHTQLNNIIDCKQCHGVEYWKPTIFDHSKYFTFDGNHPSNCSNCHNVISGLKSYTCYNCHEHTEARIAEKHREEGINNFDNCVKCHRSGNEHDVKGQGDGEGGEGEYEDSKHKSRENHSEHNEGDDD